MVLDRFQSGKYSSTSELVNTVVKNLLEDEHDLPESGKQDLTSLAL
jgi:Arc/MetJ-type ribon-helix-helix transcriptional regulator